MSDPPDDRPVTLHDGETIEQIGDKLIELRRQLREAIERDDTVREHEIARQLAGLPQKRTH